MPGEETWIRGNLDTRKVGEAPYRKVAQALRDQRVTGGNNSGERVRYQANVRGREELRSAGNAPFELLRSF
jgi:hypothetical protein